MTDEQRARMEDQPDALYRNGSTDCGVESAPPETDGMPPDEFELRRRRIAEHRREALESDDPRISTVGAVAADLMTWQLQVGEAVREILGMGRVEPQLLARNREALEMQLKLSKQVISGIQLFRRLQKDERASAKSESE
jgi:hypothetical protein